MVKATKKPANKKSAAKKKAAKAAKKVSGYGSGDVDTVISVDAVTR